MLAMTDPADSPHSSPSASSTSQSPALPWEVIERAIDLCAGDKATLCAFALTCSQLHPRSLFVLFTNVDIQSQEQLKRFYDAVQAQPQLQPVVQLLSFPWDDFSPFPLLSILPSLRHVAFDRISLANTRDRQLGGRPLAAGLRSLTIRGASFPTQSAFLKFISAFPNIENLTCELDLYLHEDTPMMQDLSSRRLQLRTLNVRVNSVICAPRS
ncbi:hypothetical protein BD309DRAFT_530806 [Dichomitus squalens]|nr:hypothetical protein BD309DRAFT_530806 [Dichomitus squalens]